MHAAGLSLEAVGRALPDAAGEARPTTARSTRARRRQGQSGDPDSLARASRKGPEPPDLGPPQEGPPTRAGVLSVDMGLIVSYTLIRMIRSQESRSPRALLKHMPQREFRRLNVTARFFRVLGDPTRLKVLELLLTNGELSVSAMLRDLGIRQGRLSSHLACLRWCGYVTSEERGRFTYYRVTDRSVREIVDLGHRLAAENSAHLATCTRIDPPRRRARLRQARA